MGKPDAHTFNPILFLLLKHQRSTPSGELQIEIHLESPENIFLVPGIAIH